ncbi:proteasome activator [Brevibacterium metallidurans]|uniref:Bacterial proteasome activator n=1 Tax=Brevibacterium metallidurans TaxID=1482676 RepID=A0ABN0SMD0_9MICO
MTENPTSTESDQTEDTAQGEATSGATASADAAAAELGDASSAAGTGEAAGASGPGDTTTPGNQPSTNGEAATEAGTAAEDGESEEPDISSPAKVMRIGTMVKQLLEEARGTELDEKGRERLAQIHRRSIEELEDGLSSELVAELDRFDLPFDSADGPPSASELRIAQAQLVGWLEGLFHGIQTAIMAQQAMASQDGAGRGQLPAVTPGGGPGPGAPGAEDDKRRTGNYL